MHDPNPIDVAAQASGEPTFREVGVGPWSQTHPGEPRPDDASSPNYDIRFDSTLLDEGDRRNVLDCYRYWTVAAIKADLDSRGRHDFEVAVENWTHDFNIGSMVRTANAFQARRVHIVGPHKWNRKGALMTELYQHVENHPSITELVECWKLRIAGEIAAAQSQAAAIAFHMRGSAAATDGTSGTAPNTSETMAPIKIVQGDERLFVAMPSRKDENGVFRDIVHPISAAARKKLEAEIMETYQQHLALMEAETEAAQHAQHV